MNANLARMLLRAARAYPDEVAVFDGTLPLLSFAQLAERAARCARGLRHWLGLAPGERVALVMDNCPQSVELLYGIWHAGLCAVPIDPRCSPREIAYILFDSGARACFVGAGLAVPTAGAITVDSPAWRALFEVPGIPVVEAGEGDLAWLFYAAGSSVRPPGAMLSHRNLTAMAWAYGGAVAPVRAGDSFIHATPLAHGFGLYIVPYIAEGASLVLPPSRGFEPRELAGLAAAHRRPTVFATPAMLKRLLAHVQRSGAELGNLKVVLCGGEPLPAAELQAALDGLGPRIARIHGQAEVPLLLTAQSAGELARAGAAGDLAALGSVGQAGPGIEVRVVDHAGRALPAGAVGEVWVRGATVMRGRWNGPAAGTVNPADGWRRSGDLGSLDDSGRLTVQGVAAGTQATVLRELLARLGGRVGA